MLLNREQLLQMLVHAHYACKLENMNCPWCSGKINSSEEWHDCFCMWSDVAKEIAEKPKVG